MASVPFEASTDQSVFSLDASRLEIDSTSIVPQRSRSLVVEDKLRVVQRFPFVVGVQR